MIVSCLLLFIFVLIFEIALCQKTFSIPIRHVKRRDVLGSMRIGERFGQRLSNTGNMEYRGHVLLGSPPQLFEIVYDTGSTSLWVPRKGCTSSGDFARKCWRVSGPGLYDPDSSSTANDTKQPFEILYNSGMAKGNWFEDKLTLGSADEKQLQIPGKVVFGVADKIKFDDIGILGLSLPKPNNTGNSILALLIDNQLIQEPIFTSHLKKCSVNGEADNCRSGGQITFGGQDVENCQRTVKVWAPITPGYHWRFRIDQAKLDGQVIGDSAVAIVDSGTSYILAPFTAYRQIIDKLKARQLGRAILAPCNSSFELSWTINDVELRLPSSPN
ncbi:Seminal fluid protein [Aphelenchoides bicaudatus]|nr:Seminal fluid protein [Aphelenchoides bicaudatus]